MHNENSLLEHVTYPVAVIVQLRADVVTELVVHVHGALPMR